MIIGRNTWPALAILLAGASVAAASDDPAGRDPAEEKPAASDRSVRTLRGHERWVLAVAYNPDGTRIASGSDDETLRVWDAASGEELSVLRGPGGGVASVAFSPDGRRIVSGSRRVLKLWKLDDPRDEPAP